ncbi:MAG: RDD family protein [Planctomycetes bacterium]|nr:RDD family protein [Planctomycetota bacterium]
MAVWITRTAEGVELRQDLAGAGSRSLAAAIDLGILVVALWVAIFALALLGQLDATGSTKFLMGLVVGGWLLLIVGYFVVFEIFWGGQTPGKRALRLQVRSLDGGPVQVLQSILRGAFVLLDLLLLLPLPLGIVLVAATPLSQRLGDLAAGTMVVRLPRRIGGELREPWPGERWSGLASRSLPLVPALASRFSRADLAYLRHLLARGEPALLSDLDPQARRRLYVEAARDFGARIGVERFEDARVLLRELYLFLREMNPGSDRAVQRTRKSGR